MVAFEELQVFFVVELFVRPPCRQSTAFFLFKVWLCGCVVLAVLWF